MINLMIALSPLIVALAVLLIILVRSISEQYGYRFFITPIIIAIAVLLWMRYWLAGY